MLQSLRMSQRLVKLQQKKNHCKAGTIGIGDLDLSSIYFLWYQLLQGKVKISPEGGKLWDNSSMALL